MSGRLPPHKVPRNYESVAWRWMRYSGILLIPLVWIHLILQDVVVGVHQIDENYVAARWGQLFWRGYDISLLGFALAHGVNGLRQIMVDYIHHATAIRVVNACLAILWAFLTFIGATAILIVDRSLSY